MSRPATWVSILQDQNLAVDSDGETYSGADIQRVRARRYQHRRRLQLANTRRARWRLRQSARREHRFQKDTNHRISKALVQKAQTERKALVLEDLIQIRERVTVRRSQRRVRHSWAFRQLRTFISYNAQQVGVRVVYVDPRNTSRRCAICGYCDKRNRPNQAHFRCLSCGHTAAADTNAAVNIARVAAVNQPIVSLLSHSIEKSRYKPRGVGRCGLLKRTVRYPTAHRSRSQLSVARVAATRAQVSLDISEETEPNDAICR